MLPYPPDKVNTDEALRQIVKEIDQNIIFHWSEQMSGTSLNNCRIIYERTIKYLETPILFPHPFDEHIRNIRLQNKDTLYYVLQWGNTSFNKSIKKMTQMKLKAAFELEREAMNNYAVVVAENVAQKEKFPVSKLPRLQCTIL